MKIHYSPVLLTLTRSVEIIIQQDQLGVLNLGSIFATYLNSDQRADTRQIWIWLTGTSAGQMQYTIIWLQRESTLHTLNVWKPTSKVVEVYNQAHIPSGHLSYSIKTIRSRILHGPNISDQTFLVQTFSSILRNTFPFPYFSIGAHTYTYILHHTISC